MGLLAAMAVAVAAVWILGQLVCLFVHVATVKGEKMSKDSSSNSGGVGIIGLLGIVFVTLKLCGVIDWSWWWVTAPFWGGTLLLLLLIFFIAWAQSR